MPTRTCIGCRRQADAHQLTRLRWVEGVLSTDTSAGGRGVWLCRATFAECAVASAHSHRWTKVLPPEIDPMNALRALLS